ncbi:hypothetical protein [Deinococcus ficus]|uniref:Uncharacterized protein n=1 Tax=Deinococcus ficus TaxID=317577 RepID=A0A221T2Q5_9DEIO|nr:hypothetical protein [Deinococcus ficus]ASN83182.1 hypothetical protein DFI_18450 [Deinococcus ficus]
MDYFLKARCQAAQLMLTAYDQTGFPIGYGVIHQLETPFLLQAVEEGDRFEMMPSRQSVRYASGTLYLGEASFSVGASERTCLIGVLEAALRQQPALQA